MLRGSKVFELFQVFIKAVRDEWWETQRPRWHLSSTSCIAVSSELYTVIPELICRGACFTGIP